MAIINAIEVIVWVSFLAIVLFYTAYFSVLCYHGKRDRDDGESSNFFYPRVSMIVPVYNEKKIIDKKIQNIKELSYPKEKMEVIFVDGCSTDGTPEKIQNHIENNDKFIRLIRQDCRKGYNEGICAGISNSTGEIIILTDAGAFYQPYTIHYLVRCFRDLKVGAVTGKEIVLNKDKALAPKLEAIYRSFYDFMRVAETKMDSTPDLKGEASAVRKEICEHLIPKVTSSNIASFDCCIPYQAKMEGYKTVYEEKASYYENAPATLLDRMKQQIRRGAILIGSLILFKNMLFNRKYDKFGQVVLPAHFVMQLILPWMFLLGSIGLLILTILDPINVILIWTIFLVAILSNAKTRLFVISFIQSQVALIIATLRVLTRRKSLFIDTIPSTRG